MQTFLLFTVLLSTALTAPLPQPTTCVASTLNIGTCDTFSGNVIVDIPVDISPSVDLDNLLPRDVCVASTLNPGACDTDSGNVSLDAPVDVSPTIGARAPQPQGSTCVASTLNVGTCDDGSGNVSVNAPVTVDPTLSLRARV
jgi:hypothetical protein